MGGIKHGTPELAIRVVLEDMLHRGEVKKAHLKSFLSASTLPGTPYTNPDRCAGAYIDQAFTTLLNDNLIIEKKGTLHIANREYVVATLEKLHAGMKYGDISASLKKEEREFLDSNNPEMIALALVKNVVITELGTGPKARKFMESLTKKAQEHSL